MRISRPIATRLIQETIRHVWAADDAIKLGQSASAASEEIKKAQLALLALIDLVKEPAVVTPSTSIEGRIRRVVYEMIDKITNLLDVPRPRPGKRRKRKR